MLARGLGGVINKDVNPMDKKAPVYEIKPKPKTEKANFRSIAVDSLKAQSEALELMASRTDREFDNAINLILYP